MVVRENHWRGSKKDISFVSVDRYNARGLVLKDFYQIEMEGLTLPEDVVRRARYRAFSLQEINPDSDVVITYVDAENMTENSRNAPLDGHRMGTPKCVRPSPGKHDYSWQPLTTEVRRDFERKVRGTK